MYEDISLEQAWQLLREHCTFLSREVVSAADALGRILGQTLYAGQDLPPQAQSAVDGYALGENHSVDHSRYLLVQGRPTSEYTSAILEDGQAIAVDTGEVLPLGTVAVIPHEKVSVEGQYLRVLTKFKPGENIKKAGEDFARNEILLSAGTQVDPAALGLLAAFGINEVEVVKRPQVAIICLADNIVPCETEPHSGQMRDSNGPMLSGFISQQGGVVAGLYYSSNIQTSIKTLLEQLAGQTELILLVGGTYLNGENTSRLLMEEVGSKVLFWGVSIQPGSHAGAGKFGNCLLLSLSGNPAACAVNYHLYAAPVIRGLQGIPWYYRQVTARCRNGLDKKTVTRRFVRGKVAWQDQGWEVEVLPGQKPSMLRSWLGCNGLIDLPPGSGPIRAGEKVKVMLLTDYTDHLTNG
ncbi:MAG TPA: molybdopterin molybdotransferase MoeA [Syntrophomonadaceae bacterium]|nr:molybdopterin molybdotransferase MoeA [Syntrophomonadaceae bacterium]